MWAPPLFDLDVEKDIKKGIMVSEEMDVGMVSIAHTSMLLYLPACLLA